MVTDGLRKTEEETWVSVAMGQPQQDAWATWEAVENRQVK